MSRRSENDARRSRMSRSLSGWGKKRQGRRRGGERGGEGGVRDGRGLFQAESIVERGAWLRKLLSSR